MDITAIGVVGAGQMGNGIAHVAAAAGFDVTLTDISAAALDRARATIEKNLGRLVNKEKISEADAAATLSRIAISTDTAAVGGCQLVIEAATENVELKYKIFEGLSAAVDDGAILATNTSSISITAIAARTSRPDLVIGMHFMNPVPVMKLIEVIRGHETSDETTSAVLACSESLGKVPVEATDYPGFVANRVLMPMINEAVFCLMEGVASRDGIDTVMKLGMAHPMGPLALADLIGLDVCLDILEVLHSGLGDDKYRPCPLLRRMVAAGHLGRKSGKGFYDYQG